MVYRGRPSTGCKTCRERKIKCDERLGGCVKCAEKKLMCPGYDRNTDVFFHDETAHVKVRAKKAKAKAIAARDARHALDALNHSIVQYKRKDWLRLEHEKSPDMFMIGSIVDHGVTFFMSRYCASIDQPAFHSKSYDKYLATNGFKPILSASMTALGLAGVANIYKDPSLKNEATRWYLKAINLANAALSSPTEARSDATLVAVGILGVYEATHNENSVVAFHNHIEGAASLIKMRGKDLFSSPAGFRMYFHIISMYTLRCMGKGIALPQFVQDMNKELATHLDVKHPRMAYFSLHIEVVDLRAHIMQQNTLDLEDIIQRALNLDKIAASIFVNADDEFKYDEVKCKARKDVFDKFYHVYPTLLSAQTHNCVRYSRIYLHDIIRNSILTGFAASPPVLTDPRYSLQLLESTRTLRDCQEGILASIPQFLHDVSMDLPPRAKQRENAVSSAAGPSSPESTTSTSSTTSLPERSSSPLKNETPSLTKSPEPRKDLASNFRSGSPPISETLLGYYSPEERVPVTRLAGSYSIAWALLVAGAMPTASPESRDFAIASLTRIERECGVSQASWMAKVLRFKKGNPGYAANFFDICHRYVPLPLHNNPIPSGYSSGSPART